MKLPTTIRSTVNEAIDVYLILLKILVPTILLVKALESVGGIEWLGNLLSPMMGLLGLPDAFGVVWAATMMTNIFTGLVVFASVAAEQSLSVSQMTVLGILLLLSHSLPIEGAVAKRAGVPWRATLMLRIGGALLLGFLIHGYYSVSGRGTERVSLEWLPEQEQDTMWTWLASQLQTLVVIFFVILALVVLLRVLRAIKFEQLLHRMLAPPLRLLGIGPNAANVMVIGLILGLSFGAGLLIRDVDSGKMSARDSYLALCFLGLAHSMIDDSLLIMVTGGDIIICIFARLVFAIVTVAVLSRYFGPRSPLVHETGVK